MILALILFGGNKLSGVGKALGVGVASICSDSKAQEDSFGLVDLCSIGPILAEETTAEAHEFYVSKNSLTIVSLGEMTEWRRY